MHMYQVTIWCKIQSWYESFHLKISLDKCLSEALTCVFLQELMQLNLQQILSLFYMDIKFFSFKKKKYIYIYIYIFFLCNRGMKINLNKLHFLSSHFSSQPNKRVFPSFHFSIFPTKHEEKLNLFHISTKWK